jgi:hypothetical protein
MCIGGEHVFTLVTFDGCHQPLLGFDIMAMLRLQLDPHSKQILKSLRRFKLVNFILQKSWMNRGRKRRDG